ncbi:hypothetical protein ACFQJ8_21725 [Halocatena marina]|uniref:hypothetical protein n=1 Tax=Halocatena marina TaxID=2934937 RepID=UPI00360DE1C2
MNWRPAFPRVIPIARIPERLADDAGLAWPERYDRGEDSEAVLREAQYAHDREDSNNAVIWDDYFYYEALTRATRSWEPYW